MRQSLLIFLIVISPSLVLADEPQNKPFAVIELFSSEGCSSCPPADYLVSKLAAWARQNNEPIYPLVFHVDYWNHLGWRDVFSSKAFTQRQAAYARIFKDQGVYTPEMIVNGNDAFVGSDQKQLQKDLDRELSMPGSVTLQASLIKQSDQIIVKYKAQGFSKDDVINVAVVERGLSTAVTAGENAGRTLHHDNVVREFQSKPLTENEGEISVSLNKVTDPSQASFIIFVQDKQTMLIEAAQQLDLLND